MMAGFYLYRFVPGSLSEDYLDRELLGPYYDDGPLAPNSRESCENILHLKWLSATYGKIRLEKAGDWLMTKE